jgi:hypothetical protein
MFFKELFPAFHCNLFIFKEKIKRIFVAIRARAIVFHITRTGLEGLLFLSGLFFI